MKLVLISVFFTSLVCASPIQEENGPQIEAMNTYLFGEPNPEWLKYINEDGYFDPSLIEKGQRVNFKFAETFYDAFASVKFWLYTREEPERRQILLEDFESIKSSTFNPNHPIRFLIHGWQSDEKSDAIQLPKKAYLEKGEYNVIGVDWSKGANSLNYYTSRHRVGNVAEVVRRFIEFLVKNFDVKTSQIQLAGHSLGAHIAGLTAKHLEVGRIPVVVGLDPALPLFSIEKVNNRLDVTDADYVEVLHTAAGSLGFDEPIGKADFYPNYGRSQPGCGLDLTGACAHSRAVEFFAESIITDTGFWSNQCGDYVEIKKTNCQPTGILVTLGGDPLQPTRAIGNYYLSTNKRSPYAKGYGSLLS